MGARGKTGLAVAGGCVAEEACIASTANTSGASGNGSARTAGASETSETATVDVGVRSSGGCASFAWAINGSPRADRGAAGDASVVGIPAGKARAGGTDERKGSAGTSGASGTLSAKRLYGARVSSRAGLSGLEANFS